MAIGQIALAVEALSFATACALLARAAVVDWRTCRIPNACVLALAVLWAATAWAGPVAEGRAIAGAYGRGLVGAAIAGGFVLAAAVAFERVTGRFALGGGDVKLVAAIGLYGGAAGALAALAVGCTLFLAAQPLLRRRRRCVAGSESAFAVRSAAGVAAVDVEGDALGFAQSGNVSAVAASARDDAAPGSASGSDAYPFGPFLAIGALAVAVVALQ